MNIETVIYKTKEKINAYSNNSEDYELFQKLLSCAEICEETLKKFSEEQNVSSEGNIIK